MKQQIHAANDFMSEVQSLKNEMKNMHELLEKKDNEIRVWHRQVNELQQMIQMLRAEREEHLTKENTTLNALREQIAELMQRNATLETEANNVRREQSNVIERLQNELAVVQTQYNRQVLMVEELTAQKNELLMRLERNMEQHSVLAKELQTIRLECTQAQRRYEELVHQKDKLHQELQQCEESLAKERNAHADVLKDLQERDKELTTLRHEIQRLQDALHTTEEQQRHTAITLDSVQRELETLQATYNTLTTTFNNVKTELQEAHQHNSELYSSLMKANEEILALKKENAALRTTTTTTTATATTTNTNASTSLSLTSPHSTRLSSNTPFVNQSEYGDEDDTVAHTKEISILRHHIAILMREKSDVCAQLHQQTKVLQELLNERGELATQIDTRNTISSLQETIERLQAENRQLLLQRESLLQQVSRNTTTGGETPPMNSTNTNNNTSATIIHPVKESTLEQTVAQLQTIITELKTENAELRRRLEEHSKEKEKENENVFFSETEIGININPTNATNLDTKSPPSQILSSTILEQLQPQQQQQQQQHEQQQPPKRRSFFRFLSAIWSTLFGYD